MTLRKNPAERLRDRLEHWMGVTKLGQRELAKTLGKSQIWLQKVLAKENHVRLKDLDDIADALRTTASELLRTEEERYTMELAPTEVRIIERLRHRPDLFDALASLLDARVSKSGTISKPTIRT